MKISTYHKWDGDEVYLNMPIQKADLTYGSWLFAKSPRYACDVQGGPGFDPTIRLDSKFEEIWPDYNLFNLDFSLGYTWEYCPRKCPFCVVPKQRNPKVHRSIWGFHNSKFRKICLLNNNTFSDPQWRETFEEIWDAGLTVRDENGYDLRLLDEEKAEVLKRTRFEKQIHFAWDLMEDEAVILRGLNLAQKYKLNAMVYVLIGFNTSREEDLYRCQKISDLGFDLYPMPYNGGTKADRAFKRFICLRAYRKYPTLEKAWTNYRR